MCQTGAKQQTIKFGFACSVILSSQYNTKTEIRKRKEVFEGCKKSVKRYNNVTMRPSG
jgi:hypothetical protein